MLTVNDFLNIIFPVLSHWILWLAFFLVAIGVLYLYALPYIKKPRKEFNSKHIGIPIANVLSFYIFTKMLEGYIYQGSILKVDVWVNGIIFTNYFPWINSVALFITNFGSSTMIAILFIIAVTVLLVKKRWRYAIISTIAILGALLLQVVVKILVHRARPVYPIETGFSFPSGHAIMAITFVALLIYSFKDDFKNKTVRYVLIIVSSLFFISVGISRIIIHVHWFSDVVAGIFLGLFWFMSLVLVERSIPGLVPAVKLETKTAKPIVPKGPIVSAELAKTAKKTVKKVVKSVMPATPKASKISKKRR